MDLEKRLSRYSEEGTFESSGQFTLDRGKALEKLAGHSLTEWREVLFSLGAWLSLDGQAPVLFDPKPKLLIVSRPQTSLTVEQLAHLEDYILADNASGGLAELALLRHIWQREGKLAIEVAGLRRVWEKGKGRVESGTLTEGVRLEFFHRRIDIESTVEFLSRHFGYTRYPWAVKDLSMVHAQPSARDVMLFNLPPLAVELQAGVVLEGFENEFQLLCRWDLEPVTTVVVQGVSYPLYEALHPGLKCVVFCHTVQLSLTKTDAVVARCQRELWGQAISELLLAFIQRRHFWEGKAFLTRHKQVLLRRLWPELGRPEYLRIAQRLVSSKSESKVEWLTDARIHILTGDFELVRNSLLPLVKHPRSREEEAFLTQLQQEYCRELPPSTLPADDLEREILDIRSRPEVGRTLPILTHATLMNLARRAENLGLFNKAEGAYLDAYFLPQGEDLKWSIYLERSSIFDSSFSKVVLQRIQRSEAHPEYIGSILSAIALAQVRHSPLTDVVEMMYQSFRNDLSQEDRDHLSRLRLEGWRLDCRQAQKQWFHWLFTYRLEGWKPRFPPPSFDEFRSPPEALTVSDSLDDRRLNLRARTACLEYASLALRCANESGIGEQSKRFSEWLTHFREVQGRAGECEEGLEVELARAAIELGDGDRASILLKDAIRALPAGDLRRLPLLVDLAVLQPNRAVSVLNGLSEVLNLNESVNMTRERRLAACRWPFPYELPERIQRLAWNLNRREQVRAYRIATLLYDRMLTPAWRAPSERDWVKQALSELEGRG